jgi:hypothetical protein
VDERSPAERTIARSKVDESGAGRPLSRRARHTKRSVEAYLRAGVMPRHMERLREIEAERRRLRSQIARLYWKLQEDYGEDRAGFAREWRRRARSWNFDEVNQLIEDHNEWYPAEAQLPLNPRTGDYVTLRGRSYRRRPLDANWILEHFPAERAR